MVIALLLAGAAALSSGPADPCASLQPGAAVSARVVTAPRSARDTLLRATVCVVPAKNASGAKVGSYHGELHFSPGDATVSAVEKPSGGVRVENPKIAGQVNFAGAAPDGFPGRALVTVVLRLRDRAKPPALRLEMKELNTTEGRSLMAGLVVAGTPR